MSKLPRRMEIIPSIVKGLGMGEEELNEEYGIWVKLRPTGPHVQYVSICSIISLGQIWSNQSSLYVDIFGARLKLPF